MEDAIFNLSAIVKQRCSHYSAAAHWQQLHLEAGGHEAVNEWGNE
jgi:hypothetical protein